jgi:hypothetical protein
VGRRLWASVQAGLTTQVGSEALIIVLVEFALLSVLSASIALLPSLQACLTWMSWLGDAFVTRTGHDRTGAGVGEMEVGF